MDADVTLVAFEALAWIAFVSLLSALGLSVLFQVGFLPSNRLSAAESRVGFADAKAVKKRQRLAATRIPGRSGAWNALVDRHDLPRMRAVVVANRRRRWIVGFAFLVAASLVLAVVSTLINEFTEISNSGNAGPFVIARGLGLVLAATYGWLTIPVLTAWSVRRIQRMRLPLEWRLLGASQAVSWLVNSKSGRAIVHENPRNGLLTPPKARQLLARIEAELVETLAPSRKGLASDHTTWRTLDAPRLTLVLESKARLLDAKTGVVAVEDVYSWLDEVVETMVQKRTPTRILRRTVVAPEINDGEARKRSRVTLNLPFWTSPAAALMVVSALIFALILIASVYPSAQPFFTENPVLAETIGGFAAIAGTGVATYIVSVILRGRTN